MKQLLHLFCCYYLSLLFSPIGIGVFDKKATRNRLRPRFRPARTGLIKLLCYCDLNFRISTPLRLSLRIFSIGSK